jgi:hypothetical protein
VSSTRGQVATCSPRTCPESGEASDGADRALGGGSRSISPVASQGDDRSDAGSDVPLGGRLVTSRQLTSRQAPPSRAGGSL